MNEIQFTIGIGLKAPIAEGSYKVGAFDVEAAYPALINFGMGPEPLPAGLSTVFIVKWRDAHGEDARRLHSKTHHRHLIIHKALSAIN